MDLYQVRVSLPLGNAYLTTVTARSARAAVEAVENQNRGAVHLVATGTMNPKDTYVWDKKDKEIK